MERDGGVFCQLAECLAEEVRSGSAKEEFGIISLTGIEDDRLSNGTLDKSHISGNDGPRQHDGQISLYQENAG